MEWGFQSKGVSKESPTCIVVQVNVQSCDCASAREANFVLGHEGVTGTYTVQKSHATNMAH